MKKDKKYWKRKYKQSRRDYTKWSYFRELYVGTRNRCDELLNELNAIKLGEIK